ncbi:MAG TPA: 3-oxoacyl-[acyl-carrier-protein] synthase III C-terminal domain-containing protein [Thermoanaerobaculia bacterium]|nr:3-oxoacyl-[acyl-carrier-protein] synthase III C-terminal domain-containing protein [Thermoanaerobaculia bacterium]
MRSVIIGSGIGVPKNVITNEALTRIMDTTDEWIRARSGVIERRYADDGQGSAELGMIAAQNALAAAEKTPADIDALIFATMTPNFYFPGNGPVVQAKMGFGEIPTFDIRQQCSGFLYGLDLADSLIQSGKHKRVLLIGADVHTPLMPWDKGWNIAFGSEDREPTAEEYEFNTRIRDRTVLFGDGAGAVVIEGSENGERGFIASRLFTNGANIEALYMKGGSRTRPWIRPEQVENGDLIPLMEGREVFRQAVSKMPEAVRAVCERVGMTLDDIDVLLIHQANLRIVEAVAKQLGLPPEKVPHNIERYGNTTAGTLPILFHECVMEGDIRPGMLVCFTALGSGMHWGAALYRA